MSKLTTFLCITQSIVETLGTYSKDKYIPEGDTALGLRILSAKVYLIFFEDGTLSTMIFFTYPALHHHSYHQMVHSVAMVFCQP